MNISEFHLRLFVRARSHGLVLDANLLLLVVVGGLGVEQIRRFKRTRKFEPDDFRLMSHVLNLFPRVLVSPNILTEVSNLLGQIDASFRRRAFEVFRGKLLELDEVFVPSQTASGNALFTGLGLTDSGVFELARNSAMVLTDDLALSVALERRRVNVVNYNHLRYS